MARKTDRYSWTEGDFTVLDGISLPDDLKDVVSNAPKDDKAIGKYLKGLLSKGDITQDDIVFLLQSGALNS